MENEESPVALILCAEKSEEVIELLELDKRDIRVPQYLTAMPPKEELEEKLHLAIERAKIQLEQRKEKKLLHVAIFVQMKYFKVYRCLDCERHLYNLVGEPLRRELFPK